MRTLPTRSADADIENQNPPLLTTSRHFPYSWQNVKRFSVTLSVTLLLVAAVSGLTDVVTRRYAERQLLAGTAAMTAAHGAAHVASAYEKADNAFFAIDQLGNLNTVGSNILGMGHIGAAGAGHAAAAGAAHAGAAGAGHAAAAIGGHHVAAAVGIKVFGATGFHVAGGVAGKIAAGVLVGHVIFPILAGFSTAYLVYDEVNTFRGHKAFRAGEPEPKNYRNSTDPFGNGYAFENGFDDGKHHREKQDFVSHRWAPLYRFDVFNTTTASKRWQTYRNGYYQGEGYSKTFALGFECAPKPNHSDSTLGLYWTKIKGGMWGNKTAGELAEKQIYARKGELQGWRDNQWGCCSKEHACPASGVFPFKYKIEDEDQFARGREDFKSGNKTTANSYDDGYAFQNGFANGRINATRMDVATQEELPRFRFAEYNFTTSASQWHAFVNGYFEGQGWEEGHALGLDCQAKPETHKLKNWWKGINLDMGVSNDTESELAEEAKYKEKGVAKGWEDGKKEKGNCPVEGWKASTKSFFGW